MVDAAKAASAVAPKEGEEKEGGAASSSAPADANHALVRNLIGLHAQYNEIVNTSFEKTQVMQKALKKAFEDFINKDNRVSKLLAKFVHDALKKVTTHTYQQQQRDAQRQFHRLEGFRSSSHIF